MTTRNAVTGEGREPGKVSTERKKAGKGIWLMPLLLALPFLAAIVFAAVRFGPAVLRYVNVLIKAAVVA